MKRTSKILGTLIAVFAIWMIPTASAQADPFELSIDNAILDLGELSGVRAIDSTLTPPDPPATLTGTVESGVVNVPAAGFVFPPKSAEVSPGITAVINMSANDTITGSWDASTGALDLNVSLKATVNVFSGECVITPINLTLSTQSAKPYLGEAFTAGLAGDGAFGAEWTSLPPVTGPATCGIVGQLIGGPGGIWMSQGIATARSCSDVPQPVDPRCDGGEATAPSAAPSITSGPQGSTNQTSATFGFVKGVDETQAVTGFKCSLDGGAFEACDSGTKTYTGLSVGEHKFDVKASNDKGDGPVASRSWTVTRTAGKARLAKPGLKFKPKAVKRGKRAIMTVRVRNAGNAVATGVRICVKAPAKLVSVKKCTAVGRIAAGRTVAKKIAVKAKRRKGAARIVVTVTGKGVAKKSAAARLRVR